jgi:hypothetical protein
MATKVLNTADIINAAKARGFLKKSGIRRRPGISKNAGKVILLKTPNTTTPARMADENSEDRCLFSTIRWIKTRLHATANVSIELEKVCV